MIRELIEVRDEARDRDDYVLADRIRERLVELGVEISDSPAGTTYRIATEDEAK